MNFSKILAPTDFSEPSEAALQYAVELGVPGVLLFLMLFRRCLYNTSEVLAFAMQHQLPTLFLLTESIRISLMAFAVAALFHPAAYDFYFYYIAGMSIASRAITADMTQAEAA